jgi:hypothetical protein
MVGYLVGSGRVTRRGTTTAPNVWASDRAPRSFLHTETGISTELRAETKGHGGSSTRRKGVRQGALFFCTLRRGFQHSYAPRRRGTEDSAPGVRTSDRAPCFLRAETLRRRVQQGRITGERWYGMSVAGGAPLFCARRDTGAQRTTENNYSSCAEPYSFFARGDAEARRIQHPA